MWIRTLEELHAATFTDNPDVLHSLYIATDFEPECYCITDCSWGHGRCAAGFGRSTKHECKTVLLWSTYMKTRLHLAVICPATTCLYNRLTASFPLLCFLLVNMSPLDDKLKD